MLTSALAHATPRTDPKSPLLLTARRSTVRRLLPRARRLKIPPVHRTQLLLRRTVRLQRRAPRARRELVVPSWHRSASPWSDSCLLLSFCKARIETHGWAMSLMRWVFSRGSFARVKGVDPRCTCKSVTQGFTADVLSEHDRSKQSQNTDLHCKNTCLAIRKSGTLTFSGHLPRPTSVRNFELS